MKILWIMKKYLDRAVDKSARIEMLRSLRRLGHEPKLLTGFRHLRSDYGLPGAIEYVPSFKARGLNHGTFFAGASALLAREIVTWRPDVVVMDPNTCLASWPWLLARRLGVHRARFVLDVRTVPVQCHGALGRVEDRLFGLAVRYARRWMDGTTVISPLMRRTFSEQFGLDPGRVGVWSSGVSLEHFDPARYSSDETARLRRELGLDGRRVLLYHGTLEPERGLGSAIRGLAAAGEKAVDVAYLIIGRGSAVPELRREADRLGVGERVMIREPVAYSEVPRYVAAADAGMLPLPDLMWWRVSSPIKLMEFLAMGKPTLLTEIEAHRDVLGESPFGFYAGRGDPEAWAGGLIRLRRALSDPLRDVAAEARDFAARSLSWDRQAERLCEYLASVQTGTDGRSGVQVLRCSGVQADANAVPPALSTPQHPNTQYLNT